MIFLKFVFILLIHVQPLSAHLKCLVIRGRNKVVAGRVEVNSGDNVVMRVVVLEELVGTHVPNMVNLGPSYYAR